MRIQFVNVPGAGIFGEPSGKVLMCVSEVKGKIDTKDFDDYMQKRLGVAGVLITDEVVRFDPAQPESDLDWAEAVHPCERCLVRPGGTRVASQDCDHA